MTASVYDHSNYGHQLRVSVISNGNFRYNFWRRSCFFSSSAIFSFFRWNLYHKSVTSRYEKRCQCFYANVDTQRNNSNTFQIAITWLMILFIPKNNWLNVCHLVIFICLDLLILLTGFLLCFEKMFPEVVSLLYFDDYRKQENYEFKWILILIYIYYFRNSDLCDFWFLWHSRFWIRDTTIREGSIVLC